MSVPFPTPQDDAGAEQGARGAREKALAATGVGCGCLGTVVAAVMTMAALGTGAATGSADAASVPTTTQTVTAATTVTSTQTATAPPVTQTVTADAPPPQTVTVTVTETVAAEEASSARGFLDSAPDAEDPAPVPDDVTFANCAEARAAGAAPLFRGQPGYDSSLDRDDDGVACEG